MAGGICFPVPHGPPCSPRWLALSRRRDEDFEHFLRLYLEWRDELHRYFVLLAPRDREARKLYARTWLHLAARLRRGPLTERNGFPVSLFRIAHRCARRYWKRHYATVETRQRIRDLELALLFDRLGLDVQQVAPVLGVKPLRLARYLGEEVALARRQRFTVAPRAGIEFPDRPPNHPDPGRGEWPDPHLEWWLLQRSRQLIAGRPAGSGSWQRALEGAWLRGVRAWRRVSYRLPSIRARLPSRAGVRLGRPRVSRLAIARVVAVLPVRRGTGKDDLPDVGQATSWPAALAGSGIAALATALLLVQFGAEKPAPVPPAATATPPGPAAPEASKPPAGNTLLAHNDMTVPHQRERQPAVLEADGDPMPGPGGSAASDTAADDPLPGYEAWEPRNLHAFSPMYEDIRDPASGMTLAELERAVEFYFAEGQVDHALQYLALLERLRASLPPEAPPQ